MRKAKVRSFGSSRGSNRVRALVPRVRALMQIVRIRAKVAFRLERLKDSPSTMDKRSLTESIDTTTAQGVLIFHMFSALEPGLQPRLMEFSIGIVELGAASGVSRGL